MTNLYPSRRLRGMKTLALSWEDIVWEAEHAIGKEDSAQWLKCLTPLLEHPHFVPKPVPCPHSDIVKTRLSTDRGFDGKKFFKIQGCLWVSPHPEAYCKLDRYQIWNSENLVNENASFEEALFALNLRYSK